MHWNYSNVSPFISPLQGICQRESQHQFLTLIHSPHGHLKARRSHGERLTRFNWDDNWQSKIQFSASSRICGLIFRLE